MFASYDDISGAITNDNFSQYYCKYIYVTGVSADKHILDLYTVSAPPNGTYVVFLNPAATLGQPLDVHWNSLQTVFQTKSIFDDGGTKFVFFQPAPGVKQWCPM
jgi:hypothetical protein